MRDLVCELDNYRGKSYLKYKYIDTEEKTCEEFNNMDFLVIDVKCKAFADIMSKAGGFTANMTTRLFQNEHLDVYYMMLAAIPQSTNNFVFNFIYLDKNYKLLKYFSDDNCIDYLYFKKKFESCIINRGSVYDLDFDFLKEQISDKVSSDFDLIIEGRPVTKEDIIIFNNSDFCLSEYEKKFINKRNLEIDHFEFKLSFGGLTLVHLDGKAVTTSNKTIKQYEIGKEYLKEGIITDDDYINYERKKLKEYFGYDIDPEITVEDYRFTIPLSFAKKYSDKLSYKKSKYKDDTTLSQETIEEMER